MPPVPMNTPMVMKNGTAIREKDQMPLTICCGSVVRFRPCCARQIAVDRPTAYAIGKRRKIITRKLPRRISVEKTSGFTYTASFTKKALM